MSYRRNLAVVSVAIAAMFGVAACSDPVVTTTAVPSTSALDDRRGNDDGDEEREEKNGTVRRYGKPVRVGNGTVRTYLVLNKGRDGAPIEVGVAMSEASMHGLPAPMAMSAEEMQRNGHAKMSMYILDLPRKNPTQYQFVQFDWNAAGHEPAGVYDIPHFDYHFYTVPVSLRNSIVPTDPQYAQKAANFPAAEFRAPFYIPASAPANAPPAAVTVPQMGLHWLDVRSPELQGMAGNPAGYKPFTRTFIYGSWDGQFIFDEPMITRAYIMEKRTAADPAVRDEIIPVSSAARRSPAGFYPSAYRITWDADAKEYRVALTQLSARN